MTIAEDLLKCVPIGEENAVGSRLIWKHIGMWAPSSVKSQLYYLAAQGLIQTKIKRRGPT